MKRALTASSFCTPIDGSVPRLTPASIIMPLSTTIATWPPHTARSPGSSALVSSSRRDAPEPLPAFPCPQSAHS